MSRSIRYLRRGRALAGLALLAAFVPACASSVVATSARAIRDEEELVPWRPATAADLAGHWRARSIGGPAAAVVMDLAYWIEPDGAFTGAALFAGAPPHYEVLSGTWTMDADGTLQLGAEAAPARAEVAQGWLRLSGDEGSLVLERAVLR